MAEIANPFSILKDNFSSICAVTSRSKVGASERLSFPVQTTVKRRQKDVEWNGAIPTKLLNSTHSITSQHFSHQCEEEKTINQGFNPSIMPCQPITRARSGPPPT